ncbi:Tubulin_tyrosine ligase [Hexamita inflata]|uniref:Tubulin tyrosine ligase n=1 Tax=Hexamita inflata TaxID=28002 RepID=A0AA86R7Z1_9EUKA|nr:Tubulin tyrosine ligase [Hexamita inflata]
MPKPKKTKKLSNTVEVSRPVYKFYLGKGNNEDLVRQVLLTRSWWAETDDKERNNLLWQQWTPSREYYETFQKPQSICSHLAGNIELHSKLNLYKNVCQYLQKNAFKILMPTYQLFGAEKVKFENHFQYLSSNSAQKPLETEADQSPELLPSLKPKTDPAPNLKNGSKLQFNSERVPVEFQVTKKNLNKKNLWILKPEGLNRGHGIVVVSSINEIQQHIDECRKELPDIKTRSKSNPQKAVVAKPTIEQIVNVHTNQQFLIQKYIENPLLFDGRKFDIRCYGLMTAKGDCYVYNRGYLRLTTNKFDLDSKDPAVHLTNNAVQKLLETYCGYEEGNMQSFAELDQLLQEKTHEPTYFTSVLWPKIIQSVTDAMASVSKRIIGKYACQNCFELFGFDFMITDQLNHILIECNANPCLELSSPVSWWLLPELLDDVFDLTIDRTFSISQNKQKGVFEPKTLEYWRKTPPEERKVIGMRFQAQKVERKNEFKMVIQGWKVV